MKLVHVGFHEPLLKQLEEAASEDATTKSHLIREAVVEFLNRRALLHKQQAMQRYAEEMAPHSGDFVDTSDELVVEQLLKETDW